MTFFCYTFTFKQFLISIIKVRMQEAKLAKEKMHGKLACGRPLVVRLASERYALETADSSKKATGEGHKLHLTSGSGQTSRSAKIAAIKNKLKSLEEDNSKIKKQKKGDNISWINSVIVQYVELGWNSETYNIECHEVVSNTI